MNKILLSVFLLTLGYAHPSYAGWVNFECGAPVGQTCYIVIIYKDGARGGTKNFELKGGQVIRIDQIFEGDRWCSTRNEGVPNINTCTRKPMVKIND